MPLRPRGNDRPTAGRRYDGSRPNYYAGLLSVEHARGRRAYEYRAAGTPEEFLVAASRQHFQRMLERYVEAALAAFFAELGELTVEQRNRLRALAGDE